MVDDVRKKQNLPGLEGRCPSPNRLRCQTFTLPLPTSCMGPELVFLTQEGPGHLRGARGPP